MLKFQERHLEMIGGIGNPHSIPNFAREVRSDGLGQVMDSSGPKTSLNGMQSIV